RHLAPHRPVNDFDDNLVLSSDHMVRHTIRLTVTRMLPDALLSLMLCSSPAIEAPEIGEQICVGIPSAPVQLELHHLDAGDDPMWADGIYLLSTGDIGEVSFVLDGVGGEAYLAINGYIIAHAAVHIDPETAQPVTTTWWPEQVEYPPELIAELVQVDLPGVVADSIPQEFKCSPWAKKMLEAGKYPWSGAVVAGGAACCIGTSPSIVGCVLCAGAIGAAGEYIGDKIGDHCD